MKKSPRIDNHRIWAWAQDGPDVLLPEDVKCWIHAEAGDFKSGVIYVKDTEKSKWREATAADIKETQKTKWRKAKAADLKKAEDQFRKAVPKGRYNTRVLKPIK